MADEFVQGHSSIVAECQLLRDFAADLLQVQR